MNASAAEVLIFDDDPLVAQMMQFALEDAGYHAQLYADGTRVESLVSEVRPRLVILDVMMPGLDGLSACKALRSKPDLKDVRIVICSGKSVGNPGEVAKRLGADLFIQKPFVVADFIEKVGGLIGAPAGATPEVAADPVFVSVLGCRSAETGICVVLEIGEQLLVLDAGRGLKGITPFLKDHKELRVFFTHYHSDHTDGLSQLRDVPLPLTLCGPNDVEVSFRELVDKALSPATRSYPTSLYTIVEGSFKFNSQVKISGLYVNHPGATMAIRIEACGKTVVFCPDNEVRTPSEGRMHDGEDKLKAFARDADLLIHDARYSVEDYAAHQGEGHSAFANVVDLSIDAGVKRLMLIHLDPSYTQEQMLGIEQRAKDQAKGQITELEVSMAREGTRFQV